MRNQRDQMPIGEVRFGNGVLAGHQHARPDAAVSFFPFHRIISSPHIARCGVRRRLPGIAHGAYALLPAPRLPAESGESGGRPSDAACAVIHSRITTMASSSRRSAGYTR
ncbi:hypothetical protein CSX04_04641 [Burkholderia cepacia]|nr:hypothetical protein CSX04_04641 [Burkholderia cepacia]